MPDTKQTAQDALVNTQETDDGEDITLELSDEPDDTEPALDETGEGDGQSGGGEDETGSEPEGERPLTSRKSGRAEERIRYLANDNAQLKQRLAALEQSRQAEERRQMLESMSPEERQNFEREQRYSRLEFEMRDMTDRNAFELKAQTNPTYRRLQAKVEEALAHVRAGGQNLPREAVLQVLVGQEVLARTPKAAKRQVAAAAQRRAAVKTTAANGNGGVASGSGRKPQVSLREKLADVPI